MSQRRSRNDQEDAPLTTKVETTPLEATALKLDDGEDDGNAAAAAAASSGGIASTKNTKNKKNKNKKEMAPLSIDDQFRQERHAAKIKHWKESPFAVGLTEISWGDDFNTTSSSRGPSIAGMMQSDIDPDDAGCMCCSSFCCGRLMGATRVGNMVVLSQTHEWVEEVEEDEETGDQTTKRYTRPKLNWMMGPYWPMLLFVTYPLILGVSLWTMLTALPQVNILIQLVWTICTVGLIYALAMTAFRDPGILYRHARAPPQAENTWRWNDTAHTYRPRGAFYDTDCAVVVEGFDHTCPWTGTAIGKRNMLAFQFFVCLVFVCLIFDIMLLTGAFVLM